MGLYTSGVIRRQNDPRHFWRSPFGSSGSAVNPYIAGSLAARYDMSSPVGYLTQTGIALLSDLSGNSAVNVLAANASSASNSATSPTKSITGNQTITAVAQLTAYPPAANTVFFSNINGNNGLSFSLLTTGKLQLSVGNGASQTTYQSTVATSLTAPSQHTFAVVYTDGASGSAVFSVDGAQLGTTVATAVTLTNGATTATIGGAGFIGYIASVVVGSVYNFQPSVAAKLAASFVAPTTGETWTINTTGDLGARICGARDLVNLTGAHQPTLSGGGALFNGSSQFLGSAGFSLSQPITLYAVMQQVTWTSANILMDGDVVTTMQVVQTTSTPQLDINAGSAVGANTNLAVATDGVLSAIFSGASSQLQINRTAAATGNAGTGTPAGFTLGSSFGQTKYGNIRVKEVLIYAAAHSQVQINQIVAFLGAKWGISV